MQRRPAHLCGLAAVLLVAGCGQETASKRPVWLSKKLEKKLVRNALHLRELDHEATLTRAFVVRASHKQVERLGGWSSSGKDHPVYVLEVWGEMTLCHSAPRGLILVRERTG